MASLTTSAIGSPATLLQVKTKGPLGRQTNYIRPAPSGIHPLCMQSQPCGITPLSARRRKKHASIICAAASEGQTQTITRESSTITVAPVQGKEKSPDLDDGGTGLPPRDDDGGGGGGGGGGWSGGFFFFGFLALLGFMKDNEEDRYQRERER